MMTESVLVSVIVPVYNTASFLEDCIVSLIRQTYQNLQIILIDDGSTDRSGAICDHYAERDERILVIHGDNRGLSSARNQGVQKAAGQWVTFVDSDDYVHPEMIETLLAAAVKKPAQIIMGDTSVSKENYEDYRFTADNKKIRLEEKSSSQVLEDILNNRIRKSVWGILYQADLVKTATFPEGRIYEDLPYHPLVMRTKPTIVWVDQVIYVQRVNPDSITHQRINLRTPDRIRMKELQAQRIARYFPELEALALGSLYADCMVWQIKADQAEDQQAGEKLKREIYQCRKRHPLGVKVLRDPRLSLGRKASLLLAQMDFNTACRIKKLIVDRMNQR